MKKRDYSAELEQIVDKTKYVKVEVADEMKKSFIAYAMAVNVSRAIPDVRDGLKPVHRRIIYAMGELNLFSDKQYKKCARIVGEVLGKYHPHGDTAVYDALVRLAQDFSIRCPLVDGHGNFGSVDGDSAAAMRYTEARLSKIASEMLRDIDKETVPFYPNFDDTLMQPQVLPSRFPNLLVNGSDGIAVGMATNIPPHNLGEVIDGVVALIHNPDITIDELISIIPAPDFPTGAIIMGKSAINNAYRTGKGGIVIRAKAEIEEEESGKHRIIITELPYQVNKSKLIEQIADLYKDKKIDGISDIQDQSDRFGMRIVIDIKKDFQPQVVLNHLYKHTNLQVKDGIIFLALADGQPKILNLKEMLSYYLEHQKVVVLNRTKFDLQKAQEREHIVHGLCIALENIDRVIAEIKKSREKNEAIVRLMEGFNLSEKQAQAILDMRLQKLTGLEMDKLHEELKELTAMIADYTDIINNPARVLQIIEQEITEIKEKYSTPRKSEIAIDFDDIDIEDLIPREDVVVSLTKQGYVKRIAVSEYRAQRRGGVGLVAHKTKDEDLVKDIFICSSHDNLMFFTNKGKVYCLKAYEVPEATRTSKGRAMVNLLEVEADEKVTNIITKHEDDDGCLVMATKLGLIKKTRLEEFSRIRRTGKIAITLKEGDELVGVVKVKESDNILMGATSGKCINFNEANIRPSGRTSQGVKSMNISGGEEVVAITVLDANKQVLTISENGYGKRTLVSEYREQSRGGKGTKAGNFNDKTGKLVCLDVVDENNDILVMTDAGIVIRTPVSSISIIGRATTGVKLMKVGENAKIVSVAITNHEEEDVSENQETDVAQADENMSQEPQEQIIQIDDSNDNTNNDSE